MQKPKVVPKASMDDDKVVQAKLSVAQRVLIRREIRIKSRRKAK